MCYAKTKASLFSWLHKLNKPTDSERQYNLLVFLVSIFIWEQKCTNEVTVKIVFTLHCVSFTDLLPHFLTLPDFKATGAEWIVPLPWLRWKIILCWTFVKTWKLNFLQIGPLMSRRGCLNKKCHANPSNSFWAISLKTIKMPCRAAAEITSSYRIETLTELINSS